MVSVREIERTIQQNNSCVQWEREAKVRFSKHMKLLMNHFVKEVEKNRTDKRRRITPQVVDNTCVNILHIINEGEKNGE
jgi:hypothetical protein